MRTGRPVRLLLPAAGPPARGRTDLYASLARTAQVRNTKSLPAWIPAAQTVPVPTAQLASGDRKLLPGNVSVAQAEPFHRAMGPSPNAYRLVADSAVTVSRRLSGEFGIVECCHVTPL